MNDRTTIIINGKFLLASLEGMPRVAREVCRAFDDLLAEDQYAGVDLRMAVPRDAPLDTPYKRIRVDRIGLFRGFLWEQIDFPLYAKGRYSLNFTNTAPLLTRNGCVVVHDAQFLSSRSSHQLKSRLLYGQVTPRVAQRYRTVVTVSDFARRDILTHGICRRSDLHVIGNGVDHVLRHAPQRALLDNWGLSPGSYALANSYVHTHKNVRVLLEAFARLPRRRLVLFGSSGPADYAERGIAVPDNVTFLGRVSDESLVALMAHARMFLFPSRTEGFGLPPLEAMLLGCPTICAAAGALPENCGDAVLYCHPDRPEEWHDRVAALWTDKAERSRLRTQGRARAQGLSWMTAARSYLDLVVAEASTEIRVSCPRPRADASAARMAATP